MAFLTRLGKRRRTFASVSTVSVCATAIAVLAVLNPGYEALEAEVNDSGVWVTNRAEGRVGRFNYEARAVDSWQPAGAASFDVLQQDAAVVYRDESAGAIGVIDPAEVTLSRISGLPDGAQVGLGGGVVAILDGTEGRLWILPVDDAPSFSANPTDVVPEALAAPEDLVGGALAVGLDGTVHVATAAEARLRSFPIDDDGRPREPRVRALRGVQAEDSLAVTAVGSDGVVLDVNSEMLYLPQREESVTGVVELQEPGPSSERSAFVVYATRDALVKHPFAAGEPEVVQAMAAGTATRPVVVKGCAYGAWAGESPSAVRDCPGADNDRAESLPSVTNSPTLQYRVNRGFVVLNDVASGVVWLAAEDFRPLDAWSDVIASNEVSEQDQSSESPSRDPLEQRDLENRPPVAEDDTFGVRPMRTTVLPVLLNDSDPDGDVLTVSLEGQESEWVVKLIEDGRALQVAVPDGATGETAFEYKVDDGRGGTDVGEVRLEVSEPGDNRPPERRLSTEISVAASHSVDINALADWYDPDGDPLLLVNAEVQSDDEVQFRPDGVVTFSERGKVDAPVPVLLTVSDGQEASDPDDRLIVTILGSDNAPDTKPDHATTVAGVPVLVAPLTNDVDPDGDQLTLSDVDAADAEARGATVERDFLGGVLTFTAPNVGTYYLTYDATDGLNPAIGIVRIDVMAAVESSEPPIAVRDTALLPATGSVLVDVLVNDSDPAGGVLVVQSVVAPEGVSVAVVNHHMLRITWIRSLPAPVNVTYLVSNGVGTAAGEVTVIELPAPEYYRAPVAVADSAIVHVGDVVTIPVLANDYHPDRVSFTLVRSLAEALDDPAAGLVFTTDDAVRFQAGQTPGRVHATYTIVDAEGRTADAAITIQIQAAEANDPPRATDVTARVLAGSEVRIAIPLDGIDPDGDSVRLIGLGSDLPKKGYVTAFGDGWLDYRAVDGLYGTDRFTYQVEDARGGRDSGAITIGIAKPAERNLPPVALSDEIEVRPGREVAAAVLGNDVDPEGALLHLASDGFGGDASDTLQAATDDDRVLVVLRTPNEAGQYSLTYTAMDDLGQTSGAVLTVVVNDAIENQAPIARDDVLTVADVAGQDAVVVPVLENDGDPDGSVGALTVDLVGEPEGTTVAEGGTGVRVTVRESAQVIPYVITDPDGATATAFVWVPGTTGMLPILTPGRDPLKVQSGETVEVRIPDWVTVGPGKTTVRLTDPDTVAAVRGEPRVTDLRALTFTAEQDYAGPAALTFEVVDTEQVDDPAGLKAWITVPLEVTSDGLPPEFIGPVIRVEEGGEPVSTDLSRFVTVSDGGDSERLRFARLSEPPAGLTVDVRGQDLVVSAAAGLKGQTASVEISVTDGVTDPVVAVASIQVTGSTAPLAKPNVDVVSGAHQGVPTSVWVLKNDVSPFPDAPLTLRPEVVVETTGAGDAQVDGEAVVVTPAPGFVGTMVVRYRVADKTDDRARDVDGRIELTVLGKPEAPTTPAVVSVGNQEAVLSWTPPNDNGALIDRYVVRSASGPAYSQDCTATTCTLKGLTNNETYTFTVEAHNEVEWGPASLPSAEVRPDMRPDAPEPPTLTFVPGQPGQLTVTWVNRAYADRSPISGVTLQISEPVGGTSKVELGPVEQYVWTGLTNGTPYTVQVQATNSAPEPSDWSAPSAAEVPADRPDAPAAPTAGQITQLSGQAQMTVSWQPPTNTNGDEPRNYTVRVYQGTSKVSELSVPATATSWPVRQTVSETPYTVTVSATNKAGEGPESSPSAARQFVNNPGPVGALRATDQNNAALLSFTAAAGNGASSSQIYYEYSINSGAWSRLASDNRVTSGLANNGVYSIRLRTVATVDGVPYISPDPQPSVANVRPYGAPGTPGVSGSVSGGTITFSWTPPAPNGRAIAAIQYRIDGAGDTTVGPGAGSTSRGYSQNETHCVSARAQDENGDWGSWSGQWCGTTPRTSWTVLTTTGSCPEDDFLGSPHFDPNTKTCTAPGGFIRSNTTLTVTCSTTGWQETTTKDRTWYRISGGTLSGWLVSRATVSGDVSGIPNC